MHCCCEKPIDINFLAYSLDVLLIFGSEGDLGLLSSQKILAFSFHLISSLDGLVLARQNSNEEVRVLVEELEERRVVLLEHCHQLRQHLRVLKCLFSDIVKSR